MLHENEQDTPGRLPLPQGSEDTPSERGANRLRGHGESRRTSLEALHFHLPSLGEAIGTETYWD